MSTVTSAARLSQVVVGEIRSFPSTPHGVVSFSGRVSIKAVSGSDTLSPKKTSAVSDHPMHFTPVRRRTWEGGGFTLNLGTRQPDHKGGAEEFVDILAWMFRGPGSPEMSRRRSTGR